MEVKAKVNKSTIALAKLLVIALGACCFIAGFEAGWYGFLAMIGISILYAFASCIGIIPILGPAFFFAITYFVKNNFLLYYKFPIALNIVWMLCGMVSIFLTIRVLVGASEKMKERKAKREEKIAKGVVA